MPTPLPTLGLIVAITLAQTTALSAQQAPPVTDWAALGAVTPGGEIIVKDRSGKNRRGRLMTLTDATLVIKRDDTETTIDKDDVAEVYLVRSKEQKAKFALIGAGAGAAVGALAGQAKNSPPVDDGEIYTQIGVAVGVGIGALVGTMIGAGRRKRTLIYRAP